MLIVKILLNISSWSVERKVKMCHSRIFCTRQVWTKSDSFLKMAHKDISKCGSQWGTHCNIITLFVIFLMKYEKYSNIVISNNLRKETFHRPSMCFVSIKIFGRKAISFYKRCADEKWFYIKASHSKFRKTLKFQRYLIPCCNVTPL